MKIIRNGIEIILTADELEQAYREQKHNYLLGDAEDQFNDFIRLHYGDVETFAACFGFSAEEVCDETSSHYLLEMFLAAYEKGHDCEQAENDMWQEVIRNVLIGNAVNVTVTYSADYALWDVKNPASWRKITILYPSGYSSLEELYAAEPSYIAAALERHGVHNGPVCISTSIRQIKKVGSDDSSLRDVRSIRLAWTRNATMADGKLVFAEKEDL